MKRFATEMTREEYLILINLLKKAGAYDEFYHNILMKCDICDSFIIKTGSLFKSIMKIESKLSYEQIGSDIDIFFSELKAITTDSVIFNLKDWIEFQNSLMENIPFLYIDGDMFTDSEGNPLKLVFEECSFVFNPECVCNPIMEGKS